MAKDSILDRADRLRRDKTSEAKTGTTARTTRSPAGGVVRRRTVRRDPAPSPDNGATAAPATATVTKTVRRRARRPEPTPEPVVEPTPAPVEPAPVVAK